MPAVKDMTDQKFGRLLVVEFVAVVDNTARWKCICDCGEVVVVSGNSLRRRLTTSCGCYSREVNSQHPNRLLHGHAKASGPTRTYNSWANMRQRCNNPKVRDFHNYGGRGITVCERWTKFENFLADMGEVPDGMELDRYPNNDGNYEPSNCRWATRKQNNATGRRRPKKKMERR